jgi:hypothetical protein
MASALKCSRKSILRHLLRLKHLHWIGYNRKSGYYFIRSFASIMQSNQFRARTGAEFKREYLNTFKSFLAGAVIGYIANTIRKQQAVGRKYARPNQAACFSNGYPVATRLITKKLNISIGMATKLKKDAAKTGFIRLNKNFVDAGFDITERKYYVKAFPEVHGRIRNRKGKLFLVGTDTIIPQIHFKRRKKRER